MCFIRYNIHTVRLNLNHISYYSLEVSFEFLNSLETVDIFEVEESPEDMSEVSPLHAVPTGNDQIFNLINL